jgi:NitT/TauT family transport system substrate-binding protein
MYAPQAFIDKNPATVQAIANAIVRADKWIQAAGPADIVKAVPESYLLGDRAVYIDAFLASKGALSVDGMIPAEGAATALRALQSVDDSLKGGKFDLGAVWTNEFVNRANLDKNAGKPKA